MSTERVMGVVGAAGAFVACISFAIVGEPVTALWAGIACVWAGLYVAAVRR